MYILNCNVYLKIFNIICFDVFLEDEMLQHVMSQNIIENHKTQLIKMIIKCYVNIRLFYEAKCAINLSKENYIRHKYTKLILFKHQ